MCHVSCSAEESSPGHPQSSLKPLQCLGSVQPLQAKHAELAEEYSEGEWPSLGMMERVLS